MGTPSGPSVTHTYVFYSNGTFSAKDSAGSKFVLKPLDGLPRGNLSTTLTANSTAAFEHYEVVAAGSGKTVADVTVAYTVRYQYCQPAGLKIGIGGTADWGSRNFGDLKLKFAKGPDAVNGNRASFGNSSVAGGTSLGFDWSDSAALNPSFNAIEHSVSWKVGSSFLIDPTTVATSSASAATADTGSLKECSASTRYWTWYYDGSYVGFRTSTDGVTWSSFTSVLSVSSAETFAVYCSGTTVFYAIVTGTATVNYRYGTMNSNGTITWTISNGSFTTNHGSGATGDPTTVIDNGGNWWTAVRTSDGSNNRYVEVWGCIGSPCTWSEKKDISVGSTDSGTLGSVLSLTSGIGVVYGYSAHTISVTTSGDGGSTWSSAVTTSGSCQSLRGSQFTSVGNGVYGACDETSNNDMFLKFAYGGSSWTETTLSSDNYRQTPISTDHSKTLVVFEADESHPNIYYFVSQDLGTTWGPRQTLATSESNLQPFSTTAGAMGDSVLPLAWTTGSSSPYNVRFASFPPVVPVAPVSPNSWSRPGLSPYESYFQQLTEYVSPGNGLLSIEQNDLLLPGRGMDLVIGRVFSTPYGFRSNSPFEYDNFTLSNLGNGWALNLPWLGSNYVHLMGGQAYPYKWSGSTFQVNNATNFKLVHNGDSTYDLFLTSGTDYHYASNKSLLSITDRTGNNAISFKYSSGHISQMTDTIGRTVTFSYNSNSQLSSISSGGRSWSYGYLENNLVSVTDPLSRVTRYEYNDGINRWLVTGIIYPTLGGTIYSYGSAPVGTDVTTNYVTSRNIYSLTTSASLTESISTSYRIANGLVTWANTTMADGSNSTQGYLFANFQNSKSLMKTYNKDSTGSVTRITESDYDVAGRINQTKMISPSGTLLASSQTTYDNWGNAVYASDNVGHKIYYSYANTSSQNTFGTSGFSNSFYTSLTISSNIHNALVGVASLQNGSGSAAMERYFKYDSSGNMVESKQLHSSSWLYTDYTYDSYGNPISVTDALSHASYIHYSSTYSHAYPTLTSTIVSSVNITSSRSYDSATGNLLSVTDPNGYVTSYAYDSLNRLTTITYPAIGGVSSVETYSYDDTHNILTTTDPDGNFVEQSYDGLGRMTSLQRFNGSTLYSTESYTYNWDNLVASKTTAAGSTYTYTYDQDGRLTKTTNPGSSTATTSYDDVNNIKTVTDENGHEKQYLYNWNGLLTSVKEYYKTGSYNTTSYNYDLTGNLVRQTDANGKVTTYQYDDLNRLTKTTYPDTTYESKTYDSVSNLASRTDPKGNTMNYSYDSLNRLTTISYPDTSTVSYTYDKSGNRLTKTDSGSTGYYTYDAMNRVTNETDRISAANYQVLYTYDKASNILSVNYPDASTETYSYDALNRVSNVNSGAVKFTYTVDDKISTITYGNGVISTYSYDSRDRPTSVVAKSGSTKILNLNYTYDGANNVLSINNENYTYDWLNRVSTSAGPWGSLSYNYDGAGNIMSLTKNGVKTTYGYATYNRLTSVGSVTMTYDSNGNMNQKVNGSSTWGYGYDYENRLTSVTLNSVTVQTNTYDSDGRRVKAAGTSTFVYIYEGTNLIYEKNTGSGMIDKYFYANGLLLEEGCECGYSYYYHEDALGSVRLVTQGSNTFLFSSNYQPFGPSYQRSGASFFGYIGKPQDTATGLYYLSARFYDPAMQRFITEDTYPGIKEDPQSLNRYAYVENNPLSNTDPTGHDDSGCDPYCNYTTPTPTPTVTTSSSSSWCDPYCNYTTPTPTPTVTTSSSNDCDYGCDTGAAYSGYNAPPLAAPTSSDGSGTSANSNTAVNSSPTTSSTTSASATTSMTSTNTPTQASSQGSLGGAITVVGGGILTLGIVALTMDPTVQAVVGLGLLAFSTGWAIGYVVKNGEGSTAKGAFDAFLQPGNAVRNELGHALNGLRSPFQPPPIWFP